MASYRDYEEYERDVTGQTAAALSQHATMTDAELKRWVEKRVPPAITDPITYQGFNCYVFNLGKVKAYIEKSKGMADPEYWLSGVRALWNNSNMAPQNVRCRPWDGDAPTPILPIDAEGNDRGELIWS